MHLLWATRDVRVMATNATPKTRFYSFRLWLDGGVPVAVLMSTTRVQIGVPSIASAA